MKTSKLVVVIIMLLGVSVMSTAQDNGSNAQSMAVSFGLKSGVNLATINGSIKSPESRVSFHAGVMAEFPVAEIFSLQVEALYSG